MYTTLIFYDNAKVGIIMVLCNTWYYKSFKYLIHLTFVYSWLGFCRLLYCHEQNIRLRSFDYSLEAFRLFV